LTLIEKAVPHLFDISKDNTYHAAFCAARKMPEVLDIFKASKFRYFGEVVWDKRQPGLGYSIRYQHESILIFMKGEPAKPDDALLSLISCHTQRGDVNEHPHAKPIPVMKRLIRWLCPVGGLVIDACCGIGTTGVAAVKLGRRFIGIEISRPYFDIAQKRIEQALAQLALLQV
jgi:site-specific DNA-methyltransferase (adenine-specific)